MWTWDVCVNGLNDVYTYLCGTRMNYANACRVSIERVRLVSVMVFGRN